MTDSSRTARLPHRRVQEFASGFTLLIARNLPDATRRTRAVHQYNTLVKPLTEAIEEGLRPLRDRRNAAMLLEDEMEQAREIVAVDAEIEAFWSDAVEVTLPRVRLTEDDLPKPLKGKMRVQVGQTFTVVDGSDNASDNARIQSLLAPEFFALKDPDAEPVEADAGSDAPEGTDE